MRLTSVKILQFSQLMYLLADVLLLWRAKVIKGTERGSWKPHWSELFQALKDIVPQPYLVIVSADRGLYADWLYEEITSLGWHPFLRINHQGQYQIKLMKTLLGRV